MGAIEILDIRGNPIRSKQQSAAYRGAGGQHPSLKNWWPGRHSGHSALKFSREGLSDRVHDLARNDGWGSAAVSRYVDTLVGSGWRLSAKPNLVSLGLDFEQAAEISEKIEALWLDYTNDTGFWCDVERATNMAGLLGMATRHQFADGEAIGWLGWREGSPSGFSTCLQVIDPMRLSNPNNAMDSNILKDGVEVDDWGAPIRYHIRKSHPGDSFAGSNQFTWDSFERETEWGRPIIVHLREKKWAGMSRATSCLAPIVTKLKQLTQYDDYELQAAALNSMLAAFVTTPMDRDVLDDVGDGVSAYSQSEIEYYGKQPLQMDGVQLGFLHPGSQINTVKAEHPSANFESFERNGLRNIASAAGITYEALTADYSQANYSSIRASMVEFRKGFAARAAMIGSQWQGQIYRAWLEEVFDKRLIKIPAGVPSYEAANVAWSHAKWVGPGAGWVDPKKEAEAAGLRLSFNVATLEDEVANQGGDWRNVIDQKAVERKYMKSRGIDPDAGKPEAVAKIKAEGTNEDNIDDRNKGAFRVPVINGRAD